jgi:hypothetical protein
MAQKRVIVVASGESERRSLPHLVAHLRPENIDVVEVRIPPRNTALNVETWKRGNGGTAREGVVV